MLTESLCELAAKYQGECGELYIGILLVLGMQLARSRKNNGQDLDSRGEEPYVRLVKREGRYYINEFACKVDLRSLDKESPEHLPGSPGT